MTRAEVMFAAIADAVRRQEARWAETERLMLAACLLPNPRRVSGRKLRRWSRRSADH